MIKNVRSPRRELKNDNDQKCKIS